MKPDIRFFSRPMGDFWYHVTSRGNTVILCRLPATWFCRLVPLGVKVPDEVVPDECLCIEHVLPTGLSVEHLSLICEVADALRKAIASSFRAKNCVRWSMVSGKLLFGSVSDSAVLKISNQFLPSYFAEHNLNAIYTLVEWPEGLDVVIGTGPLWELIPLGESWAKLNKPLFYLATCMK